MNQKLINKALLTSPVIAIYGIIPIILFNSIDLLQSIVSFVALTFGIFLFWLLNIFLIKRGTSEKMRYTISYLSTFFLHAGTIYIMTTTTEILNPLGFFIYSIVATLAVNTIILVIISAEQLKTKKEIVESEYQKLKVVNLEAQKKVLIQQLQPHFLFNALSTLKSLISENPTQAEDYSVKLSEFLRYSISIQANELVLLREELQFAIDYVELQRVRFGDALICYIDIPDVVQKQKIPAFALQTLIENAIKHNSFNEKKPLIIKIVMDDNKIQITNNKNPRPIVRGSGTGLINLDERYKIISGSGIKVIDEEYNFTVYLNLI